MSKQQDLFGKTFDQQLAIGGEDVIKRDISPNRRISSELVFEPVGAGIRVTARDEEHKVLWGYIGSKETNQQIHCLVATYDTLQALIAEELEKQGLMAPEAADPLIEAEKALRDLQESVQWLRDGLEVKRVSEATLERARIIARMANDANRQLMLEARTLKGMKSKAEPAGVSAS